RESHIHTTTSSLSRDRARSEIYPLSLHDALPISCEAAQFRRRKRKTERGRAGADERRKSRRRRREPRAGREVVAADDSRACGRARELAQEVERRAHAREPVGARHAVELERIRVEPGVEA